MDEAWEMGDSLEENSLMESVLCGDEDDRVATVDGKSASSTSDRDRSVFIDAEIMVQV